MKKINEVITVCLVLLLGLLMGGCAQTQSGTNKEYPMRITQSGSNNSIVLEIMLEATTDTQNTAGDAGATSSVDPAVALGMQGSTTSAAAKGAEQVLKDIMSYAEQWLKKDADNTTTTHTTDNSGPVPVVEPAPAGPAPADGADGDAGQSADRLTLTFSSLTNGDRPTYYTGPTSQSIDGGDAIKFEIGEVVKSCTAAKRENGTIGCDWPDGTIVRNAELYSARGITALIPATYAENPPRSGWIEVGSSDTMSLDGWEIVATAACDSKMSFRDGSGEESVIQKRCVFDKPGPEYGKSFIVQWSSGNKLNVVNSSGMNWLVKNEKGEKDYRKYHPAEPTGDGTMSYKPGTPAEVYAGRGDNSAKAMILVRK